MASPSRRRSLLKKIILWTGGTLVFLLLLATLLVWIFRDKLKEMALRELGRQLNAEITVSGSSVTFWSSWPEVEITLNDLRINPRGAKPAHDIISARTAVFTIDFWSLFSSHYKLSGIALDHPAFYAEQFADGKWNYRDLFQPQGKGGGSSEEELVVELRRVTFAEGRVEYKSLANGSLLKLDSLSLALSGTFTGDQSTFLTNLGFHLHQLTASGVPVMAHKPVKAALRMTADTQEMLVLNFDSSLVTLAGVEFSLDGLISEQKENFKVDLAYASRKNSFDCFVALLPGDLLAIDKAYKHKGQFKMAGWVKGNAGAGETPDFYAEYSVNQGYFKYDKRKSELSGLNLSGSWLINNKVPTFSHFRIAELRGMLNDHEIECMVEYKNFIEPRLRFSVKGQLELEEIRDFYPDFAEGTEMGGKIMADVEASGLVSDFKSNRFKSIIAKGQFSLEDLSITHPSLAYPVRHLNGLLTSDNGRIKIEELNGAIGSSDFDVNGTITEYLPWLFDTTGLLIAKLNLDSRKLDLNEWFAATGDENPAAMADSGGTVYALSFPGRIDFNLQAKVGRFNIDKFNARNLEATCRIKDQKLSITALTMNAMNGEVKLTGDILLTGAGADFNVVAKTKKIDINQTFRTFDQWAAFALVKENLSGLFTGTMNIKGQVNNRLELDPASLVSWGEISLEEGRLVNFEPLNSLAGFVKLEKLMDVKFSDVITEYRIENQRFLIPKKMKVNANDYKLIVSGSHGFDNSLNYRVEIELPRKEAIKSKSGDVQQLVEETVEEKSRISIPVIVTGTVDDPKFKLDLKVVGKRIEDKAAQQGEEVKVATDTEIEKRFGKQDTTKVEDLIIEEVDTPRVKGRDILNKIKNPFKKKP